MTLRTKLGISLLVAGIGASVFLLFAPFTSVYDYAFDSVPPLWGSAVMIGNLPLVLIAIGTLACTLVGAFGIFRGIRRGTGAAIVMSLFIIWYMFAVPSPWNLVVLPMFSLLVIAAKKLDVDQKFFPYDGSDIA